MNSLLYFPIYIFPIIGVVAVGFFFSENRKEEALFLKLVGFFFLGTLIFWYSFFPIAVGLAVGFYLIHRFRKVNVKAKRIVLICGFIVAVISEWIVF
ncbi:hypothetical protein [Evansella cellulosilytica]|uniref:hypothetical protein n=1 Tax=Evansella cellulosilytica TaxID=1413 RepID=UPI0003121D99|nr:hypothetical protein [Evansella cellulosilytica]